MLNFPDSRVEPDLPDPLRQDAHAWLARLTSGAATQDDAAAFQRWCATSPRHRQAFEEARDQWRLLQPAVGGLLASRPEVAEHHRRTLREPRVGRRAFLGTALGAVAATGVALIHPPFDLWTPVGEWRADYRTAVGEQRTVTLADQVRVTMNTRTSVRRLASGGQTVGLDLLGGEAAFDVLSADRAFDVVAGAGRSVADSGRFEVRYLDGNACVTCLRGRVRVEHPGGTRTLLASQQAKYDDRLVSVATTVDAADVSAWRRGELVFKRAPLADVITEINRYRQGRVVLMSSSEADKTLSARFQLGALDVALVQIQRSFGLSARSLPGGVVVLS
ncbi:FecR family protein [Pandoraea apista]|uniref:DUF4880 domain-containing protein n=1 Tax=Pandoraea apista TaxID=93218 RepID=A0ABX9ZLD2_9BURK|nr:FecR domain-containing protein [Pandoraea apista]ALS67673.1 hypothetical protein AT395_24525 [Pandoraea apista]PTD98915.1 DUF4880 domain-containing protein [Pandoraea apista]RRJ28597.1 DUF4880 domain-containing protein [Pandoraea apista]RRJ73627.1 DUF4880 domain-containing protein [Pandoraea apista]RRW88153.1 DUF4880 domain-containing protein [Pandoraea apista]